MINSLSRTSGSNKVCYSSTAIPFNALRIGMLAAATLAFLLPKSARKIQPGPQIPNA
jgi:hypothetical protein